MKYKLAKLLLNIAVKLYGGNKGQVSGVNRCGGVWVVGSSYKDIKFNVHGG